MHQDDRTFLESAFLFWGGLSHADQDRIMKSTISRTYKEGQIIKAASESCGGLLLVKSGQVRAFFEGEGGKEMTLYRLLPRDLCILSAPCIIRSITFDVTLSAEKESVMLLIPPNLWTELSSTYPSVQRYSMELMASRFSDVMWVLDQIISKNLGQRVSYFLKEQSILDGSDELHLTHESIARHLGTAREVVSRVLKYFESEGAIEQSRGIIRIVRSERLLL
jgi:CRP/FNR family transcriptional regulator